MSGESSIRDPRVSYALSVLFGNLGAGPDCPEGIRYAPDAEASGLPEVWIVPSGFFGAAYGTAATLPTLPLAEIEGVPLLFGKPQVKRHGRTLIVHADIVASAYFLLTRYEEWVRRNVRDEHGRFPGRQSLPFRAGFLHRPVVEEYAALLRQWACEAGVGLPAPRRRFSVLLTHDVDYLGPERGALAVLQNVASGVTGRRPYREAFLDAAAAAGLRRHSCDNLDDVIRMDAGLMGNSTPDQCQAIWFFMAGGDSAYDGGYRLDSPRIRQRLRQVMGSGGEIGLDASYAAGADPSRVAAERVALQEAAGRPINKNRHHFLSWREPDHGEAIADAGIRWDATLGYADVAGFRLGVCRPIVLFDPARRQLMGIEEHPLAVMDCTLDRAAYMNLGYSEALRYVCGLIDVTQRHQGEFVCLWHNTVLAATAAGYHRQLYSCLLEHMAEHLKRRRAEAGV